MVTVLQLQNLARLVDAGGDLTQVFEFLAHGRDILAREVALEGLVGKDLLAVRQQEDFADPGDVLWLLPDWLFFFTKWENKFSLWLGLLTFKSIR